MALPLNTFQAKRIVWLVVLLAGWGWVVAFLRADDRHSTPTSLPQEAVEPVVVTVTTTQIVKERAEPVVCPTCPKLPKFDIASTRTLQAQLSDALSVSCPSKVEAIFHPSPFYKTVLTSVPRSGNSMLRMMVQRATGYVSGSAYCDTGLKDSFLGECNNTDLFFFKTHFPAGALWSAQLLQVPEYWRRFDQVVYLERNPLDAIFSDWHRTHTQGSMTDRAKLGLLGDEAAHVEEVNLMVNIYRAHHRYWHEVPLRRINVQYELLRTNPLPILMQLAAFLQPTSQALDLEQVLCALRDDSALDPYASRKANTFYSWNEWKPNLRKQVLLALLPELCQSGYIQLLAETKGEAALDGVHCGSLDSRDTINIARHGNVNLEGEAFPVESTSVDTATAGRLKTLQDYCGMYSGPKDAWRPSQVQWHNGAAAAKACKKGEDVSGLFESTKLQCYHWCIFDLGPSVDLPPPEGGTLPSRLVEGKDDGARKGWAFTGSCWERFTAANHACQQEWGSMLLQLGGLVSCNMK